MKIRLAFLPVTIIFLIDRLIKYLASSISLGGGFVKFGIYKNYAGAFSLPIGGWLYNIAGIILLAIFIYLFINAMRTMRMQANAANIQMAYLLIVLGGASNLFDRLVFGYVIDYIQVLERSFFNIADGMIIIGICLLIYKQFYTNKRPNSKVG